MVPDLNSSRRQVFLIFKNVQTGLGAHPARPLYNSYTYRRSFPRIKRQECNGEDSRMSAAVLSPPCTPSWRRQRQTAFPFSHFVTFLSASSSKLSQVIKLLNFMQEMMGSKLGRDTLTLSTAPPSPFSSD
jgi:hypothetical protein